MFFEVFFAVHHLLLSVWNCSFPVQPLSAGFAGIRRQRCTYMLHTFFSLNLLFYFYCFSREQQSPNKDKPTQKIFYPLADPVHYVQKKLQENFMSNIFEIFLILLVQILVPLELFEQYASSYNAKNLGNAQGCHKSRSARIGRE